MPPQNNSTVDIDDHRHAGVGPLGTMLWPLCVLTVLTQKT
jgi:hypothetical protein